MVRGEGVNHSNDGVGMEENVKHPKIHAIHPHGRMNLGHVLGFVFNPLHKNVWTLHTSYLSAIPVISLFLRARGLTDTVEEKNIRRLIKAKQDMSICPGGIREMYMRENSVLYRKGFLRIAWDLQCDVVPYFSKGENATYRCWYPFPDWWREFSLRHFKYSFFSFVIGEWLFGVLPLLPRQGGTLQLIEGKVMSPKNFQSMEEFLDAYYFELSRISHDTIDVVIRKPK